MTILLVEQAGSGFPEDGAFVGFGDVEVEDLADFGFDADREVGADHEAGGGDVGEDCMDVVGHEARKFDVDVVANGGGNDGFGGVESAPGVAEDQGKLREAASGHDVERRQGVRGAGSGVDDDGEFVFQGGFEEEVAVG